jgi:hypothetical protein
MPQNAGGRGRDYRESDVRVLMDRGPEWTSWQEPVAWLHQRGNRDDQLRSADVRALIARDFTQLGQDGTPFTHDPGEAYKLARQHRHEDIESARVGNRPGFR